SWCGRTVALDVAHNPASAARLAGWLSARRPRPAEGARCWGVFACLDDKPIESMLAPFAGLLDGAAAVQLSGERSLGVEELIGKMRAAGIGVIASGDCSAVLAGVMQHSRPGDWIVVFGSFLTVAGAMQHLQQQADAERVAE
ncbi:MAG: bifunctional tetrahydrofolate synthase/dihydrofolate synthase, partial [Gammaproteobacteria bacterium AqS3]|nr:bifunctional tetrahydrofolate synthase/dihydrofolate synthase [Gammaproteobacteria bacterium AqS3]